MTTIRKSFVSFCFLFLLSLIFNSNPTRSDPMSTFCNEFLGNFSANSLYERNLNSLLSTLRAMSSFTGFYNSTVGLSPDTVRGLFLCRGDIGRIACEDCIETASRQILRSCTNQKEAVIFYEECMVRYSDRLIFSVREQVPHIIIYYLRFAPNVARFRQTLAEKMDELIGEASSGSSSLSTPYFVQGQERITEFGDSYDLNCLVQCTPDLAPSDCNICLRLAFQNITNCCDSYDQAMIFTPNCLLKYETSRLSPPPRPPPPPTRTSTRSSDVSFDPVDGHVVERIILPVVGVVILILVSLLICFLKGRGNDSRTSERQSMPTGAAANQHPSAVSQNELSRTI